MSKKPFWDSNRQRGSMSTLGNAHFSCLPERGLSPLWIEGAGKRALFPKSSQDESVLPPLDVNFPLVFAMVYHIKHLGLFFQGFF